MRTNAQKSIVHYFQKGQLEAIFFLFPDPHFKARNPRWNPRWNPLPGGGPAGSWTEMRLESAPWGPTTCGTAPSRARSEPAPTGVQPPAAHHPAQPAGRVRLRAAGGRAHLYAHRQALAWHRPDLCGLFPRAAPGETSRGAAADVEELGKWMADRLAACPLFERLTDVEVASDSAVPLLMASEEAQKVARNAGKTHLAIFRKKTS